MESAQNKLKYGLKTGITKGWSGFVWMLKILAALFLSLGLSAFWLWIPRFITAIIAVHLFDLYYKIKIIYKTSN